MWQPPHENSLKINVNGAWKPGTTEGGVGVVVRDSTGKFVAGCAIKLTNVFSAPQVEALAARTGIILAMVMGYQNVVFESDVLQIVTALRNHSIDRSVIGYVVEDTESLLTQITGEGFTHIRRTANGVAHRLARFALHIGGSLYWFEELPDFISDILHEDCNS
ncbi:PREDICTED: ribonuclease H At1g65750 [Prunus dulcis]|uniref:PREDICTED: ribonuclease H At1g65750 n=1 Tax=Prunus dulcis TaxID=3755 RepID=A0A5E4G5X9_PRUDU|nr:PREDICTED: ribonuclease H At1g65750 [Prunus dulcis]